MTIAFALAMRQPLDRIVSFDGCLVLAPADVQEVLALEALAPKRPTPSPATL